MYVFRPTISDERCVVPRGYGYKVENNLFIRPWGDGSYRVTKLISSLGLKYIGLGFRI